VLHLISLLFIQTLCIKNQLRNLEMKETTHGTDSVLLASTLGRLADMLRSRGKMESALGCLRRQVSIMEKVGGNGALVALNNLGEICFACGRTGEAEACLQRCLQEAMGSDAPLRGLDPSLVLSSAQNNPAVAPTVRNLGLALFIGGRLEEAEPLLQLHLHLERGKHVNEGVGATSESLGLTTALEMLARCCWMSRKLEQALTYYDQAMNIASRERGDISPEVPIYPPFLPHPLTYISSKSLSFFLNRLLVNSKTRVWCTFSKPTTP